MDELINEIWDRGLYDSIQDAYEEAGLDWGEVEQRYKYIIATEIELRGGVDENRDEESIEKISELIRKRVDSEARNNSKIDIYLPIFDD